MKVSVITVSYNSASTIKDTIDSVLQQTYADLEYIIIDGASTDGTADIVKSYGDAIYTFISEPDKGLYDAINKGIQKATGDIIGILNSDDFFSSPDIIATIVNAFAQHDTDAVFGDVAFVKPLKTDKVVRHYSSAKFKVERFARGYMPAHPSFYVRREMYQRFGLYKTDYTIAADYEILIRLLYTNKVRYLYIPTVFVYMRTGGVSNRTLYSFYLLNKEITRACRENGIYTNLAVLSLKYFSKVFELIRPHKKLDAK